MRGNILPSLLEYEHTAHDYSHVEGKQEQTFCLS